MQNIVSTNTIISTAIYHKLADRFYVHTN